jgi:hypothetical protein
MAISKKHLLILSLTFNFILFGQTKQNKIGICVGAAYNTQVQDKDKFFPVSYSYYNKLSPYIGFIHKDSITSWFSVKTSLYYVQRGININYKLETPNYTLKSDQSFTCHYISFPIKLNFNIKNFYFGVGLEGSILLKAHHKVHITETMPSYINENSLDKWYGEKYYQIADAGYTFNIGYRIKNFEIDFNMFHGLIPPPKFQYFTSQHFEFKYAYQQTFMLGLNYYPKFKKYLRKK